MSAEKKNKFKSIAIKLCAAGLTIVVAGLAYLFAVPKTYRAVAKVEILKSGAGASGNSDSFSLYKLPGECETARSDAILDEVITNLDLKSVWAKQTGQPPVLTADKARDQLRLMLNIQPAESSAVIEVAASGREPFEVARVANEVAKVYTGFRQASRQDASRQRIASLKAKWEAQNQKVAQAQEAMYDLTNGINEDRAANPMRVFDPEAFQSLRSRQAGIEADYKKQSEELDKLKSLKPDELRRVLATNSPDTNVLLAAALRQLAQAKTNLSNAQTANGPDAPETKSAQRVVDKLDTQVDIIVKSVISLRQVEVASLKAELSQIEEVSKNAELSTNSTEQIKAREHFRAQDEAYAKAKAILDKLIEERDQIYEEIMQSDLRSAVMPNAITARIVDLADPPIKPVSPDTRIGVAILIAGGILAGAGLLLLVLLQIKPRSVATKTG